ncbi:MAG: NADH-quinone oxidoreductase subunit N, partial [Candidatus Paceibacterales bacterium]
IAFGAGGLLIAAALTHFMGEHQGTAFFGALVFDRMSVLLNLSILAIALLTLFLSVANVNTKGQSLAEHTFLVLSAVTGMMTLISAADLMVAFIGLELMSLALYVLIGLGHEQKFSKEAAFKYFILVFFASAFFLYVIDFFLGAAATTQIGQIAPRAAVLLVSNKIFLVGVCLLMIGVAFKVSVFPFYAWTPDVYQGAPTPVTAFMATAVKLVMFGVFLRLALAHFFSASPRLILVLQVLAILTMVAGNVSAIVQENIKRVLAYSSVAHAGYMMIGIVAATNTNSPDAATAVIFYAISYSIMNIGAFAVVSLFEKAERAHLNLTDYSGIGFKYPFLGLAMAVFMLSLAGMPPTVGFIGKFYVFSAAYKEGFVWLTIFGVINSLISAYYYLRIIVNMYMKEPTHEVTADRAGLSRVVIVVSLVLTLVFGIASLSLYGPTLKSISGLVAKN